MQKRFVESLKFSISEVNRRSSFEKGSERPPFWEMFFYWTRKPLIGARAVIAASLLPEEVEIVFHKLCVRHQERKICYKKLRSTHEIF